MMRMPVCRFAATFAVLVLTASCSSAAGPSDSPVPCDTQATCGDDYRKVCENGFCGAELPEAVSTTVRPIELSIPTAVRLKELKSMRVAVVYPTTPDQKKVVCPGGTPAAGEVEIPSVAALFDRAKFNLTWEIMGLHITPSTTGTGVSINGPGRLIFVELYEDAVTEGVADSGGAPVGRGCVADADYLADTTGAVPIPVAIEPVP